MPIEKATSEYIVGAQPDLQCNLDISDKIKARIYPASEAVYEIMNRLRHANPNVKLLALHLSDTCIKNAGSAMQFEMASREFVDLLGEIAKGTHYPKPVFDLARQNLQEWALLLKDEPRLGYMNKVYSKLVEQRVEFPPVSNTVRLKNILTTKAVCSLSCVNTNSYGSHPNGKTEPNAVGATVNFH